MRSLLAIMVIGFLQITLVPQVGAMPSPIYVKPGDTTTLMRSGVATGGASGQEFSLLNVKSSRDSESEKIVLQYGDRNGQPLRSQAGYHHIALDRDGQRIVIDLAQVSRTAVDPSQLKRILATSKLVATSDMSMDPLDGSTNITITLRQPAQVTIDGGASKQGQLSLRLTPVQGKRK